ncbi:O-methyltransferase [Aspergillus nomiae NRRL 13137]|uniref:O-methyltransferase n=1 Tax=Aspergillus nomiae NRRL (strain ATCC 15546 / NRRL 13137 / CBS 260.88 / M93) TaxID=1509407 RepID=A0A0L1IU18_ASPN3|nr:O-methyltransferase [Aspergillus nomiae NRRL 13137]KNG82954.1 O-methyltransferase [Aspergillus nomiae NRRL 13137]
MSSLPPGVALASTVTSVAALGFVPVAVHFDLFDTLAKIEGPASGEDVLAAYRNSEGDKTEDNVPCLRLVQDTLYAMSGLGFVDITGDDLYSANAITKHLAIMPSAQHGALHFTTEALLGAAFLMRKLQADNFKYPFKELDTPYQYAYHLMGKEELAKQHTYSIMTDEGRMDSFNNFMTGKFMKTNSAADRLRALGYDLQSVLNEARDTVPATMVDIGGGRGELLLDIKAAYSDLQASDLVVQEFNQEITEIPGITLATWNYKEDSPQPIKGALVYHLAHILHNLSDLEAARLLQKVSEAMASHSRVLIHEFPKNVNYAKMHSAMIALYAGRERSAVEWRQMATLAGLKVTFEAYPEVGEGLIEMRKC